MTAQIILTIVGVVGCVIGILTYIGAIQTRSRHDGMVEQKLIYLSEQMEKILKQNDRLITVEGSLTAAWIRIDEHKEKCDEMIIRITDIEKRCAVMHSERK